MFMARFSERCIFESTNYFKWMYFTCNTQHLNFPKMLPFVANPTRVSHSIKGLKQTKYKVKHSTTYFNINTLNKPFCFNVGRLRHNIYAVLFLKKYAKESQWYWRRDQIIGFRVDLQTFIKSSALPETSETVSFSHDTTLTYSSTEAGIMHLKTAVFPRMTLWSATRTVYGSRNTAEKTSAFHSYKFKTLTERMNSKNMHIMILLS